MWHRNNMKENIMKKLSALIAAVIMLTALLSGCVSSTVTKSDYEVTVFADAALETALTDIAAAYTNSETNPNANASSEILFRFEDADSLKAKIDGGAYYDILITADEAADATLTVSASDGSAAYALTLFASSDNPEATQAFVDYLTSSTAKTVFADNGFTVQ